MAYTPEPIGFVQDTNQLVDYLQRELARISAHMTLIEQGIILPVRYSEPAKPREGMLAIADGTSWNPGSGVGLYEYRSGSWAKL